ncbi:hypothetical protein ES703_97016 [subsurface metagenome]
MEFRPAKVRLELTEKLVDSGVPEEEARQMANKQVESMGMYKIATQNCPLEQVSPMACQVCYFGHMTECHHPLTCSEAKCSHYLKEEEPPPIDYPPGTNAGLP